MHILHTFINTFHVELTRRIFQTIKSFLSWRSFPLFSWLWRLIQGGYWEEKLDGSHSLASKGINREESIRIKRNGNNFKCGKHLIEQSGQQKFLKTNHIVLFLSYRHSNPLRTWSEQQLSLFLWGCPLRNGRSSLWWLWPFFLSWPLPSLLGRALFPPLTPQFSPQVIPVSFSCRQSCYKSGKWVLLWNELPIDPSSQTSAFQWTEL